MQLKGSNNKKRQWISLVVLVLILAFVYRNPVQSPSPIGCNAAYRMASLLQAYEATARRLPLCRVERPSYEQVSRCLRRRRQRQRRPTSVLMVGNSRLRNLYLDLGQRLGLAVKWEPIPGQHGEGDFRWSPPQWCAANSGWCDNHTASALLALQFFWRPFLNSDASAVLAAAADACDAAAASCPDLVLVNGELWYATDPDNVPPGLTRSAAQRALVFRRQVAAAAAVVRRLARGTRVVWRLDERMMDDAASRIAVPAQPHLSALHAIVFGFKAVVPELTVWASGLPPSTELVRRICLPIQEQPRPWPGPLKRRFAAECADTIHGSRRMRELYVDAVVADLCAEAPPAVETVGGERPVCCGVFSREEDTHDEPG